MSSLFTARSPAHHAILRLLPRIAVITVVGAFCASISVAGAPLTLGEAQTLAVARSRQLAAQDLAVLSSREMAVAAGQLPDPVLKLGIDNLPVSGADRFSLTSDFMTMRRVGVMQEITGTDKRQSRAAHYDRSAEKSLAEKAIAAAAIQRDTALAWLDRYYAEQMAAAIAEQAAQARLEIEAAQGAYRAGRGSQADIFAARSALASVDDRYSEIQRRVRNAKTMLARWIGVVAEDPLVGQPALESIRLDPAMLDAELGHHPQIEVLNKQIDIAEADAKLAQADKNADWSVEVAFQQRGPEYGNMVSVGLSLPLQWDQKNRQDRELSAKLAMVEQAKAERDDMLRQHVAETRTMIAEWENDRERSARYERELIPLAKQRTEAVIGAYRGGKAGLAELLAARGNQIDVRIQALQLQADTARLWAQLNFSFPLDAAGMHSPTTEYRDVQ
ncbi:MAG: TolC family protein [Burkholderiales bacterium]